MDGLRSFLRTTPGLLVCAVWLANLFFAVLHGGPLQNGVISDTWHYFAEGLALVGYGDVSAPVSQVPLEIRQQVGLEGPLSPHDVLFKNEPLLLPLFLGSLYGALCANIAYATWLWGLLVMTALMAGAYLLGRYAFSPRTGWLAALAVGMNWQLLGFGHLLVDDVGAVAFLLLGAGLYYRSRVSGQRWDLVGAGLAFGLSFATKTVFVYLFAPLALGILLQSHRSPRAIAWLAAGFAATALPFLALTQATYGNPLYPHFARVNQILGTDLFGAHSIAAAGAEWQIRQVGPVDTFHLLALPLSLGLVLAPFALLGLVRSLRDREWLLPLWAVASLALYVFVFRVYIWPDRYMVHYTPLFLVLGAAGLDRLLERGGAAGQRRTRVLVSTLAAAALLSANLSPALGLGTQLWESQAPTVSTLDSEKVAAVLSSLRPLFLFPEQRFPDDKYADFALYRDGAFPLEQVHADSRDWIPIVLSGSAPCRPNPAWAAVLLLLLAIPFLALVEPRFRREK